MTDAYVLAEPAPTKPERRPGDFDRDANGTPWVSHPTGERTKPKRKGDEGTIKRVRYARPSGFGEQILDSYNLQKWAERMIVAGVSHGLGTANEQRLNKLAPANNDDAEWRKEADSLVKLAKEKAKHMLAAERGTQAHELTEAVDTERDYMAMLEAGVDLGLEPKVQHALVETWRTMLDDYGLEILATELAVVHDGYRCAGTLDRIVRLQRTLTFVLPGGEVVTLPAGLVVVLDLKTGKLRHNNGEVGFWDNYPIQVAIYAGSVGYNTDTEERYELPWAVDQRWAIIAHLDVLGAIAGEPGCELILVDLELGRQGADLVAQAKAYEKADKFSLVGTCNVADVKPQRIEPLSTTPATVRPDEGAAVDPADVAPLRERYVALDPTAKAWVDAKQLEAQQAGVGFHLKDHYTARRVAIMDGLCVLASAGADDEALTAVLDQFVVAHISGPQATVGHLGWHDAQTFADACRRYVGEPVDIDRAADLLGGTLEEAS